MFNTETSEDDNRSGRSIPPATATPPANPFTGPSGKLYRIRTRFGKGYPPRYPVERFGVPRQQGRHFGHCHGRKAVANARLADPSATAIITPRSPPSRQEPPMTLHW